MIEAAADYDSAVMDALSIIKRRSLKPLSGRFARRRFIMVACRCCADRVFAIWRAAAARCRDRLLAQPVDIPPVEGTHPETGQTKKRLTSSQEPLSALAFKIMSDPYVGKLTYLRVYSGVLKAGMQYTTPIAIKKSVWPNWCACMPINRNWWKKCPR